MTPRAAEDRRDAWSRAHDSYLETQLERVRRRLSRRVSWLRSTHWSTDPLDELRADVVTDERADRLLTTVAVPPGGAEDDGGLDERVVDADRRLAERERELHGLGAPPALRLLAEAALLGPVEVDAVVTALAVALDPGLGPLYGYVQDDPAMAYPTPALVADLFGHTRRDAWVLLDADRPLRRFRLLMPPEATSPGALVLEPRTFGFLRGGNAPDVRVRMLTRRLPETALAPPHAELVERLVAWYERDAEGRRPRLQLVGPPAQGRDEIAAAVAARLGLVPLAVDAVELARHPERDALVTLVERELLLLPGLAVVEVPDRGDDPVVLGAVRGLVDRLQGVVVVVGRTRWDQSRPAVVQRVPLLTAEDRRTLWSAVLPASLDATAGPRLTSQFHFGPGGADAVAKDAAGRAALAGDDVVSPEHAWAAARDVVGNDLGSLAQRVEPALGFDDLVLPEAELGLLRDLVAQAAHAATVYETWGLGRVVPRGQGITALFTGASGTGKTMAAEVLAGALDLDLYRVDLSKVVSKYIGETEKNLGRVFDAADSGGAVLFFDEADALFGRRTEVKDSHDRYANVEIDYLLQRMEDYRGIAILATNRKSDLDSAFLRRIRAVIAFPFPGFAQRRRIWQVHLPDALPRRDVDLDALARLEVTGGSIRNIVVGAAFAAAAAGGPVTMAELRAAAGREYRKLERVANPAELGVGSGAR